jgi:thiosulfate reductase cytochrome b subunit
MTATLSDSDAVAAQSPVAGRASGAVANGAAVSQPAKTPREILYRHRLATRVTHWINALCVAILVMSGLQIFNAHPRLYWGEVGAYGDPAAFEIGAYDGEDGLRGVVRIGDLEFDTTGVFGVSNGAYGRAAVQAFPSWATIPSYRDLATGRRWHLFFAWLFAINMCVYFAFSIANGHFRRDLLPARGELRPRHVLIEIVAHARLRFAKGEAAKRYNVLQKISYLAIILIVLPAMVLTGLSMSPGFNAAAPWLSDLLGGRQSARALHFVAASLVVLFVVIHLAMVLLAGPWNGVRSMVTGRYAVPAERKHG